MVPGGVISEDEDDPAHPPEKVVSSVSSWVDATWKATVEWAEIIIQKSVRQKYFNGEIEKN